MRSQGGVTRCSETTSASAWKWSFQSRDAEAGSSNEPLLVDRLANAELKLTNSTMEWPNGHRGLDGIDLTVPEGQFVAVIGLSGAGKSTLLRCINGLITPSAGEIALGSASADGQRSAGVHAQAARRVRVPAIGWSRATPSCATCSAAASVTVG